MSRVATYNRAVHPDGNQSRFRDLKKKRKRY